MKRAKISTLIMTVYRQPVVAFVASMALSAILAARPAAAEEKMANPDFTRGDKIPDGAEHDWNLGATGARGWMYCDKMVTTDARQIAVTKVDKGSPADGLLAVGDVILGVGGKPFSYDPRTELGKALTACRIGGWPRQPVTDPLAGRQDGGDHGETAGSRHLQRHRTLRLPEVEAHSRTGVQGARWAGRGPLVSRRTRSSVRSMPSPCWPAAIPHTSRWCARRPVGRRTSRSTVCKPGTTAT